MSTANYEPKTLNTYKGLRFSITGNILLFIILFPFMLLTLEGELYEEVNFLDEVSYLQIFSSTVPCLLLPTMVIISIVGIYFTYKGKEEFGEDHALYLGYSFSFGVIGTIVFFLCVFAPEITNFNPDLVFILAFATVIPVWKVGKCLALYKLVTDTGRYLLTASFALSLSFSILLGGGAFSYGHFDDHTPIGFLLAALFIYLGSYFTYLAALTMAFQGIKKGDVKPMFAQLEEEWFYRAHTHDEERSLHRHYQPCQPGQGTQKTNYNYQLKLEERELARKDSRINSSQVPGVQKQPKESNKRNGEPPQPGNNKPGSR